jgi:hypothetical protein
MNSEIPPPDPRLAGKVEIKRIIPNTQPHHKNSGKATSEAEHAVAELARAVAELKNIMRGDRVSRAPLIAKRLSGLVAKGVLDKDTVRDALFQACEINNNDFRTAIASAIEAGVREYHPDRAAEHPRHVDGAVPHEAQATAPRSQPSAESTHRAWQDRQEAGAPPCRRPPFRYRTAPR